MAILAEGKAMKAVAYCRVSGLTQAQDDKGGIPRQREAIAKYAQGHRIEIVHWYEEAFTGTDLENRPAFREMREMLLSDGVRLVLIEKLDRLARDQMICELIVQDFRKHGIDIQSAEPGEADLCSNDPTRKFIRTILAAVAEFDKSILVRRMADGRSRVRAKGLKCGGRDHYGERDKAEQSLVQRISQLEAQGYTLAMISSMVNAEGFRSRVGKKLYPAQVQRILRRDREGRN